MLTTNVKLYILGVMRTALNTKNNDTSLAF